MGVDGSGDAGPGAFAGLSDVEVLLVDVMNVIGSRPDGWWRDRPAAVRRFIAALRVFVGRVDAEVVAVVDGGPVEDDGATDHGARDDGGAGGAAPLTVHHATRRGPDAADDRIVELLEARRARSGTERVGVVTADRELRARVAVLGAVVLGPRQLLAAMEACADSDS